MSAIKKPFTKVLLKKFDHLTMASCSSAQMERIRARLALKAFIKEHGKEKCDAMWAVIQKNDASRT